MGLHLTVYEPERLAERLAQNKCKMVNSTSPSQSDQVAYPFSLSQQSLSSPCCFRNPVCPEPLFSSWPLKPKLVPLGTSLYLLSHYTAAETELNFSDVSYTTVGFPIASYIYAHTAYIYLNMYLKQAHT